MESRLEVHGSGADQIILSSDCELVERSRIILLVIKLQRISVPRAAQTVRLGHLDRIPEDLVLRRSDDVHRLLLSQSEAILCLATL